MSKCSRGGLERKPIGCKNQGKREESENDKTGWQVFPPQSIFP